MTKTLEKEISSLKLDDDIVNFLKTQNIIYIKELCGIKRQELKKLGMKDKQIKQIIIKLELLGLGLDKKRSKG